MTWTPLSGRINNLPLLLVGPILRHTDLSSVTVWVALKESRKVTLSVYSGASSSRASVLGGPPRQTVQIGQNLHVVAVTASGGTLVAGTIYYYDLDFGGNKTLKDVVADMDSITYGGDDLPSFALPPIQLEKLRLIHGSCRKPNALGRDMLPTVDLMIKEALPPADYAEKRPHQLFLTGDQIYADDVADALLELLTDAGAALLGWDEMLPGINKQTKDLKAGQRSTICEESAGFTSGIPDWQNAKSHLFSLGEFYSMYLFVWSDVLWPQDLAPQDLPDFTDVYPKEGAENDEDEKLGNPIYGRRHWKLKEHFDSDLTRLRDFRQDLPAVRRALANIPTYMILDDHEVTDDWFMNRSFCNRVLATQLGPRVIQNALLAYAIFQGWGNTPQRFADEGTPGRELLNAAKDLHTAALAAGASSSVAVNDALGRIGVRVGLPTKPPGSDEALVRLPGALDWHYKVALQGYPYEVFVLDCRTARAYPARSAPGAKGDDMLPPGLLKPKAFDEQIDPAPAIDPDGVTIVLSQAPVVGLPWIEEKQGSATGVEVWELDVEPWSQNQPSFQTVLARLLRHRRRVVVLSGDVHYGFAARLSYRARHPFGLSALPAQYEAVLVQLTSSALKNQNSRALILGLGERGGLALHTGGFSPLPAWHCVTPPTNDFAGWVSRPSAPTVSKSATKVNRELLSGTPPILHLTPSPPVDTKICIDEDWLYRIEFIQGDRLGDPPTAPNRDTPPSNPEDLKTLAKFHLGRFEAKEGKEIVGVNNIGEVTFTRWPLDEKVIQTLWWRVSDTSPPLPMTTYTVSLKPSDPRPGSIKMNCP